MIASVLVMTKNLPAQQAVALVRDKRPGSVQTNAQVMIETQSKRPHGLAGSLGTVTVTCPTKLVPNRQEQDGYMTSSSLAGLSVPHPVVRWRWWWSSPTLCGAFEWCITSRTTRG